ncbi:MAG: hypothetical protein WBE20_13425 [Candidatus Acidiferrales bacterium]
MGKDERDLLDVLKAELQFMENGGYARAAGGSWRPAFIFEDSPACMNYDHRDNPGPCADCVLMQLVPPGLRSERIPCRHIPLNAEGETLDSLYRYGDQREVEETFRKWLQATIARLEEQRGTSQDQHSEESAMSRGGQVIKVAALHENLRPKCANPACANTFAWDKGGKFFRFRIDPNDAVYMSTMSGAPAGVHGVKHFWLCERCCHIFTLVYEEHSGVLLRVLWRELPATETHRELSAA